MGRPKNAEETKPLHTRLTTSQREAFDEYLRREQAKMPRGAVLAEAAVLRGMVLRCLDLEGIPYVGAQQTLFSSPRAPVEEPPPPPPPPVVEEPAPPPPPPPVVEEPSSPAEEPTNERPTAIGVTAEPAKTSAKKKSAKAKPSNKSTAPAKKAKPSPPSPAARPSTKSAAAKAKPSNKSTAPAKKTKKR